jgi:hypothetical protein
MPLGLSTAPTTMPTGKIQCAPRNTSGTKITTLATTATMMIIWSATGTPGMHLHHPPLIAMTGAGMGGTTGAGMEGTC